MFFERILTFVRRPIHSFVGSSLQAAVGSPQAVERPSIHTAGVDPHRILLVAQEVAITYRVLSHDLGLAGHLARQISLLTTRAVDLSVVITKARTLTRTVIAIPAEELFAIDALVIIVDGTEAFAYASISSLRRQLGLVLDHLEAAGPPGLIVCLATVTSIPKTLLIPQLIITRLNGYLRHLDREVRAEAASHTGVHVFEYDPPSENEPSTHGYLYWAKAIAPGITAALATARRSWVTPAKSDELARQRALANLGVLGAGPNAAIDRITAMASNLFEGAAAYVTFIDRDRQWVMSGSSAAALPRARAFSDVTIERPGLYVIEDVSKDERFKTNPSVTGSDHVRFYAGYPIETPDGYRVGALYILDTKPRVFSPREAALLRDLALQVQSEL
jgi:GAF domain-containing protein